MGRSDSGETIRRKKVLKVKREPTISSIGERFPHRSWPHSKCALMKTQNHAEYRRLEERKRVNLPAQMDSQGVKCLALMHDISRSGGRLLVNRMFAVGTDVEVTLANGVKRSGVVRRCLPIDGSRKFEIGFEVIEASWPESVLPPDDE